MTRLVCLIRNLFSRARACTDRVVYCPRCKDFVEVWESLNDNECVYCD